jgi:hypothetical protein
MPTLTRRRDKERQAEYWLIFADDIRIGSIGIRSGVPVHVDQWVWRCDCYLRASARQFRERLARDRTNNH